MLISDLPDFPAIQRIKEALWQTGDVRGAAVMVGAGFSRLANLNAATTSPPPLWRDFSNRMVSQLYPNGGAPSDPLRLAQEYKAALGEPALDGLIRSLIQDEQWEPSKLHQDLLALPWSDVLTTNWDTLLERTSLLETERTYDVVRTTDDIARTRAPRIVKLHGSFPSNKPFIFTEEDYRTYPQEFAPFVNLTQQVLLENELCLFGFSGDDPNFLQWSGWVRDNLGDASRQVRLVGVLDLSPSRREMLKQQNVTPIDLAPLVADLPDDTKHSKAISMFLDWLVSSKAPDVHKWVQPSEDVLKRANDPKTTVPSVSDISNAWKKDRMNHPGWLITPADTQIHFRYATDRNYPRLGQLPENIKPEERMDLLFELACRHEISFWPLNEQYAKEIQELFGDGHSGHLSRKDIIQVCSFLYAEARRRWDWDSFSFWGRQLEDLDDPQALSEFHYGKALRAKQELDYALLSEVTPKVTGDDPVWKMRQGMLYSFLYEDTKAAQCYQAALTDIRIRRSKDKKSIWLLSREAWAAWVFRSVWSELPENDGDYRDFGEWPSRYGRNNCDPWDFVSFCDREAATAFEKSQKERANITPLFDAGHYRNNSGGMRFVNHANVSAFELYLRAQETAGIPNRLGFTDFFAGRLERAFEATECETEADFFTCASLLSSAEKGLMATAFSRINVAKIPMPVVVKLIGSLKAATEIFLAKRKEDRQSNNTEKVRSQLELISRLSVRLPESEAQSLFKWAVKLCNSNDIDHWWLYKHVGNILERCLEAIPLDQRKKLSELAIFLPLSGEKGANGIEEDWPELIEKFTPENFSRPENSIKWASRVSELTAAVRSGNRLDRDRAILRLHRLHIQRLLSDYETDEFAKAIWGNASEVADWPSTHLVYPFIFLELPETEAGKSKQLFQSTFVDKVAKGAVDLHLLNNLMGGFRSTRDILKQAKPQFGAILKSCLRWTPRNVSSKSVMDSVNQENDEIERAIATFLARSLLPEMRVDDIEADVRQLWHDKLNRTTDNYMVATSYEFYRLFPEFKNEMIHRIRKAVNARNTNKIAFGYYALQGFIDAAKSGGAEVPSVLVSDVISNCENMRELGLNHTLDCAVRLVGAGMVNDDDLKRLDETVDLLWSEFTYDSNVTTDERKVTLTLVRRECARLAKALQASGIESEALSLVCKEATNDPVPEVRNSI